MSELWVVMGSAGDTLAINHQIELNLVGPYADEDGAEAAAVDMRAVGWDAVPIQVFTALTIDWEDGPTP